MIFNTLTFAIFCPAVIVIYWLCLPERARPWALIIAGAIFYAWSVPAYLALIVALGVLTFTIGRAIIASHADPRRRRALLITGLVCIVGVLATFKYSRLFAATVNEVATHHVIPIPEIIVPLAISFFTFEFVHVLVDVYFGKIRTLRPIEFAVFTMFFPTLVAGPIKRYQSFAPQVASIQPPRGDVFALNLYRIAIGVAKKMIIADSMSVLAMPLTEPGFPYGRLDYWVALLAYTTKIYFDFSGYSDIAIGVAGLLGFAIPENFDRPYWAANIGEFWNRWHISLSTWIRDYVFIPLGGSRRSPPVVLANLLIAMALSGLWHGAAWTFVLWGLWHGFGLALHRLWAQVVVPRVAFLSSGSAGVRLASIGLTFAFVALGWVLFAAGSVDIAEGAYAGLVIP